MRGETFPEIAEVLQKIFQSTLPMRGETLKVLRSALMVIRF